MQTALSRPRLRLRRYQTYGDNLQLDTLKLNESLDESRSNLKEISEFLTNELKARSLTASALQDKVLELQATIENNTKEHEVGGRGRQRMERRKGPPTCTCPARGFLALRQPATRSSQHLLVVFRQAKLAELKAEWREERRQLQNQLDEVTDKFKLCQDYMATGEEMEAEIKKLNETIQTMTAQ